MIVERFVIIYGLDPRITGLVEVNENDLCDITWTDDTHETDVDLYVVRNYFETSIKSLSEQESLFWKLKYRNSV